MVTDSLASRRVLTALRKEIEGGAWAVGSRLPSERALTERFETSRVVVREALAALRSLGMVASRPGSGAYVTRQRALTAGLDIAASTHAEILDCLELRCAVEVEAARLAAQRARPSQLLDIEEALVEMRRAVTAGDSGADADWAFHLAIAAATNNAFFPRTMAAFGPGAIPRARYAGEDDAATRRAREQGLLEEHETILAALTAQEPEAAAGAMRQHLTAAQARYRRLRPSAQA